MTPPPTAWIVTVVVKKGAVAEAVRETVAEHVGLQGLFAKREAVTPRGRADAMLNVTVIG